MSRPRIAVLDYGMGNLRSVEKALVRVGAAPEVTGDPDRVAMAEGVVLPGVGAFPRAMMEVEARGLDAALAERIAAGAPVLGICLGMQLLFERSTEQGGGEGLGVIGGSVEPLAVGGLKLPQIGWNEVGWRRPSPLSGGLPDPCPLYHVHSFGARPADSADVIGTAVYGTEFVAAVGRGNVFGVQFHPEKSGEHGQRLLANFAAACADRPSAQAAVR